MDDITDLLTTAAHEAAAFRESLATRPVAPSGDAEATLAGFAGALPAEPTPASEVVRELVAAAAPGLMGSAGPRFFGFVVGGALPAATAADILATGWDQCAFNAVLSPAAAVAEQVAGTWLKELLGIPSTSSVGFATGAQGANTVGLAAARHHLLAETGWDVGAHGLSGSPRIRVVAGAERHTTIDASLRLLGMGTDCIEEVRADANGAMDMDDLERVLSSGSDGPLIGCLQAGNVNTGACDNLRRGTDLLHMHGGWAHVDGAFGLWAAADPGRRQMTDGVGLADSWCVDGHKWLNVPYDSAFAFCSRPDAHAAALSLSAAYLSGSETISYGPQDLVLESSRRARGFAVWAALRELGSQGVADMIDRACVMARRLADGLAAGGAEIVNDVVLNQVLVGFGLEDGAEAASARIDAIIAGVQAEGTCWLGGTIWRGRRLIRISVSNYATTAEDVDASVAAILRVTAAVN